MEGFLPRNRESVSVIYGSNWLRKKIAIEITENYIVIMNFHYYQIQKYFLF